MHQSNQSDRLNVFWTSRIYMQFFFKLLSYCIKTEAQSECCTAHRFNRKRYFHSRVRLFESQPQHRLSWLSFSNCFNSLQVSTGIVQGGSNMTGTDLCVNKPHSAAACDLERVKPQPPPSLLLGLEPVQSCLGGATMMSEQKVPRSMGKSVSYGDTLPHTWTTLYICFISSTI